MAKSIFNRYCLEENLLRKVLIRIDYSGVTNIDNWIESIKIDFIKNYFNRYSKHLNNNAKIDLSNLGDISKSLSIPVSEIIREPVHTFIDSKFNGRTDKVRLDITAFYTTLSIDCFNYKNIDVYIDFIEKLISHLLSSDSYIQIKRIGIRKIGGDEFEDVESVYNVFEKEQFLCKLIDSSSDINVINREYTDRFLNKEQDVKINYTRLCRSVLVGDSCKIQVILDMDGYIDEGIIQKNGYEYPRDLKKSLSDNINDYLFELFKNSVQETYLLKHGHIER